MNTVGESEAAANAAYLSLSTRLFCGDDVYLECVETVQQSILTHQHLIAQLGQMLPPPVLTPGADPQYLADYVSHLISAYDYTRQQQVIDLEQMTRLKPYGGLASRIPPAVKPQHDAWLKVKNQQSAQCSGLAKAAMDAAQAAFDAYVKLPS